MAYDATALTKIANLLIPSPNPTDETPGLFYYIKVDETVAAITANNYFNPAANFLATGALIMIVGSDGFRVCRVTASDRKASVTEVPYLGAVS